MNLCYLGDALDHWKGSLFEYLCSTHLLHDFAVDAMATDAADWQSADWQLLAKLLRVDRSQIVRHTRPLAGDRAGYFAEIAHAGDLFLDPDTGVATGKVSNRSQYVFATELHDLMQRGPERVLAVYQHIRAKKTRDRLHEVIRVLQQTERSFSCCSYESGTVAMLFLSRDILRISGIYQEFGNLLGSHAERRICRW